MSFLDRLKSKPAAAKPAPRTTRTPPGMNADAVKAAVREVLAEAAGVDPDTFDVDTGLAAAAPAIRKAAAKGMSAEERKWAKQRAESDARADAAEASLAERDEADKRANAGSVATEALSALGLADPRGTLLLARGAGVVDYDQEKGAFVPMKDGKPTDGDLADAVREYASASPIQLFNAPQGGVGSPMRPAARTAGVAPKEIDPWKDLSPTKRGDGALAMQRAVDADPALRSRVSDLLHQESYDRIPERAPAPSPETTN